MLLHIQIENKFDRARKKFTKNNPQNAQSLKKTLVLFRNNPKHPGLNLEKLKGNNIWTIRIDKGNRIFFIWIDKNTVLFLDIGEHDKYRRY